MADTSPKTKRIAVALPIALHEQFRRIATDRGYSMDKAACLLIADYVKRQLQEGGAR